MDFTLNDDQKMILDLVEEVCQKEIAPVADEISEKGEFPAQNVKKLAGLDLFGIT
ncbi:MAG TPA: acyl-CoA dehydrogenase family protein, partial [Candidatus Aerophobetes bacterium]|nr:acyl-CoA dehydrogenase family protein [Candidatus Aerophobetes bacterium]